MKAMFAFLFVVLLSGCATQSEPLINDQPLADKHAPVTYDCDVFVTRVGTAKSELLAATTQDTGFIIDEGNIWYGQHSNIFHQTPALHQGVIDDEAAAYDPFTDKRYYRLNLKSQTFVIADTDAEGNGTITSFTHCTKK